MPLLRLNVTNATDCSHGCTITEKAGVYLLVSSPHDHPSAAVSWILWCAFLVVSMQLGFAMLEVGSCRQAHRSTVLAKNVLDSAVSMIVFWLFCEIYEPVLVMDDGRTQNHLVVFHWAFCSTAVTICSGSMAERTHMVAYLVYAVVMSGVIYPFVAAGVWSNEGFLRNQFNGKFDASHSYHDFAGSGVVHLVGGCSALMGNMLLGRRIMQEHDSNCSDSIINDSAFASPIKEYVNACPIGRECPEDKDHSSESPRGDAIATALTMENKKPAVEQNQQMVWPRRFDDPDRDQKEFRGLHYLQAMGMFTLWVGWYGFNTGSSVAMDRAGSVVAGIVALNTTLAAGAGALGSYAYCYLMQNRQLDLTMLCNGVLCGLVSITAACDVATKYAAIVIGLISSGLIFPVACHLMRRFKLDDPVEAIPVHAMCGFFGVLAVAFCKPDCSYVADHGSKNQMKFCSSDHRMSQQFKAQAWGAFTEIWWTSSVSFLLWSFFVVCESALAIEDEILERVYSVAFKMACADLQNPSYIELSEEMKHSSWALAIFKNNGWADGRFTGDEHRTPSNLLRICQLIHQAREQNFKSALEIQRRACVRFCARLMRSLYVHKVIKLRLRILPANELSGLGACDIDGGRVLRKAKHFIIHMDREAKSVNRATTAMLKSEIGELNALVHSQDVLLQALAKRGRNRRHGQVTPQSVSSDGSLSPISVGTSTHFGIRAQGLGSVDEQQVPHEPIVSGVHPTHVIQVIDHAEPAHDQASISTASERSGEQLSVHSEVDSTPPPSALRGVNLPAVIGSQRRNHNAGLDLNAMNQVTLQLIEVVRDQQRLLTDMQTTAGNPRTGGISPVVSLSSGGGSAAAFLPRATHSQSSGGSTNSCTFALPSVGTRVP